MSQVELSVVIATKNRSLQLRETVDALRAEHRSGAPAFEVIVVDDGSSDAAALDLLSELETAEPLHREVPILVLRQDSLGPAAARNRGVTRAAADYVLFLGDDTRPAAGTLAIHLSLLRLGSRAVQGLIEWDPNQRITPLMRFLAPEGPQFYFRGLMDGEPIPYSAVLGSNFSAPTQWLRDEPFDERFPYAAIEDTEMAWRWQKRGRRAVFAAQALCWHHHLYDDLQAFLKRQRRAGISARFAVRRHPSLAWKLVLEPALGGLIGVARRLIGRPRPHHRWDAACRWAYLRGFFSRRP